MQGQLSQGAQHLRLRLTTTAGSLDLEFDIGNATAELVGIPSASYIRANANFWRSQAGASAVKLAGHWIQVPSSNGHALTSSLGEFAPTTLSRCLTEDHGTMSIAGRATVNGQPAVLLKDAGDKPGSSRSVMAVAATGTPYPLRYTASGGQRPGGRVDVCNDGKGNNARGSISFSEFGKVPPIQAPKGAIRLSSSSSS
jgi:hypothetical protein